MAGKKSKPTGPTRISDETFERMEVAGEVNISEQNRTAIQKIVLDYLLCTDLVATATDQLFPEARKRLSRIQKHAAALEVELREFEKLPLGGLLPTSSGSEKNERPRQSVIEEIHSIEKRATSLRASLKAGLSRTAFDRLSIMIASVFVASGGRVTTRASADSEKPAAFVRFAEVLLLNLPGEHASESTEGLRKKLDRSFDRWGKEVLQDINSRRL